MHKALYLSGLFFTLSPVAFSQGISIRYAKEIFSVTKGSQRHSIPIQSKKPAPAAPSKLMFRKDKNFIVWDDRGLITRNEKGIVAQNYFSKIASSPAVDEEEIATLFAWGLIGYPSAPSSLLGAKRIGNQVFALLSWDLPGKEDWLKMILEIDLSNPTKLILRDRVHEQILQIADPHENLASTKRGLIFFAQDDTNAYRFIVDPKSATATREEIGKIVLELRLRANQKLHAIQRTGHNTSILGKIGLESGRIQTVIESSGTVRLLDSFDPWLVLEKSGSGRFLLNAVSSAKMKVPADSQLARTPFGVLIWQPANDPSSAVLIDTTRMEQVATWDVSTELKLRDKETKSRPAPKVSVSSKKKKPTR